ATLLGGPYIVIGGIAAGIDLRVDGGAAADDAGLGEAQNAVLHVALRHGGPAPAGDPLCHFGEARGHVEQRIAVAAAGFEQQHGDVGVFGQPVGEHAAGGSRAGDDV